MTVGRYYIILLVVRECKKFNVSVYVNEREKKHMTLLEIKAKLRAHSRIIISLARETKVYERWRASWWKNTTLT